MSRIIAEVLFDRGSHGYEETHDDNQTIENLIEHFRTETNRINRTTNSIVFYIDRVLENPDGTYQVDSEGERIVERLYTNERIIEAISRI